MKLKSNLTYKVIIPARSNSKRLPGKNMRILGNKPLIEHSIDYALEYFNNTSIWVNTDDDEIIDFSRSKEVNTIKRPDNLATDLTPTVNVLKHQVKYFRTNNIPCDAVILLQPTNPLRLKNLLPNAIELFEKSGRNSLATFSVSEKKLGKIVNKRFTPMNYNLGQRSQDLENTYYENGLLYITKLDFILKNKVITDDVFPLICYDIESSVDIDYMHDFHYAATLLKYRNEPQ